MNNKKIMAVFAVMLMVVSSVFVLVSVETNGDSSEKTLDQLTDGTYWVKTEKVDGVWTIKRTTNDNPCIVKVNEDAKVVDSTGALTALTLSDGYDLHITKDKVLYVFELMMSGGDIVCEGCINLGESTHTSPSNGVVFERGNSSTIIIKIGGMVYDPEGTAVKCVDGGNTTVNIRNVFQISATKSDLTITTTSDYDISIEGGENDCFAGITVVQLNANIKLDCQMQTFSIGNIFKSDCYLYLRSDMLYRIGCTDIRVFDNLKPISNGPIYLYDSTITFKTIKIDKDGNKTYGSTLRLFGNVDMATTYAFVEDGKTVNLIELFGVKERSGYKIDGWCYNYISRESDGKSHEINDPKNATFSENASITVNTVKVTEKDYTGFFVALFILLILAIIAPFAFWYIRNKQGTRGEE